MPQQPKRSGKNPPHTEMRANLYYAVLDVPVKLRTVIGLKRRVQSLGTSNKRDAEDKARVLVAQWKEEHRRAAGQPGIVAREAVGLFKTVHASDPEALTREAISLFSTLQATAPGSHVHEAVEGQIMDRAQALEDAGTEYEEAYRFAQIALGKITALGPLYERWSADLDGAGLGQKNIDQMRKDVRLMVEHFKTLSAINSKAVKAWLKDQADAGVSTSSRKRILYGCRRFWLMLVHDELVTEDSKPFNVPHASPAISKVAKQRKMVREEFSASDVVALWQQAVAKQDTKLADLIALGAYTGARIEELCSLQVKHVDEAAFRIEDAKTEAGVREVPIHPAIAGLVRRLAASSEDGFLISGLTFNKYGDRSNAIGKRFGRLKTAAGYGEEKVFHSIRKTVTTLLENAYVLENIAADIVGHEKDTMTYGLYSGGASLTVKAEALAKITYPFPNGFPI